MQKKYVYINRSKDMNNLRDTEMLVTHCERHGIISISSTEQRSLYTVMISFIFGSFVERRPMGCIVPWIERNVQPNQTKIY